MKTQIKLNPAARARMQLSANIKTSADELSKASINTMAAAEKKHEIARREYNMFCAG